MPVRAVCQSNKQVFQSVPVDVYMFYLFIAVHGISETNENCSNSSSSNNKVIARSYVSFCHLAHSIWVYLCVCVSFCNCFCCYFFANTRLSIAISFIQPLCLFHCNNQKYAYLLFRTCFRTQRNTNIPSVHSKNAIFYVCYFTLPIILHYFYYVAINKHCMLNFFHFFFSSFLFILLSLVLPESASSLAHIIVMLNKYCIKQRIIQCLCIIRLIHSLARLQCVFFPLLFCCI